MSKKGLTRLHFGVYTLDNLEECWSMIKKKKIILGAGFLILVAIGIGLVLILGKDNEVVDKKGKETVSEEIPDVKIKDEVVLEVGSETLESKDYFLSFDGLSDNLEVKIDTDVTIVYEDSNKKTINEKEYQKLDAKEKESYTKKEVYLNIGEFNVLIKDLDNLKEYKTILKIEDTTAPTLKLKKVTIKEGDKYDAKKFVEFCLDNSGEACDISFQKEDMGKITKAGTHEIEIVAKDISGNEVLEKTELKIEAKKKTTNNTGNNSKSSNNNNSNNSNNTNDTNNKKEEVVPTKPKEETYNKTTNDLKVEATTVKNNNKAIYNEILTSVNSLRNEVGAKPLVLDDNISLAATIRAMEMAYSKKFSHTRPNGSQCFTVLNELGISYWLAGENIAYGQTTSSMVMNSWRNSEGHYKNIIGANFTKIGVGYFKYNGNTYWVQLFT